MRELPPLTLVYRMPPELEMKPAELRDILEARLRARAERAAGEVSVSGELLQRWVKEELETLTRLATAVKERARQRSN